jgi:hypothetical protein
MDKLLDWFEEHKFGVIGTLALHSLFLLLFTMWQLRGVPTEEERSTMQMDVIEIEQAEQMIEQIENPELEQARRDVKNLTSNITATKTYQAYSSQRLSERVEEDLRKLEQEEFERLAQERRDRGEEIEVPELDPSKWSKERYMEQKVEPMKVEGLALVEYDLKGRTDSYLHKPGFQCMKGGVVVINVIVNSSGKVDKAELNPAASNTSDECLIEKAMASARSARFNSIQSGPQSGTIKYTFLRQ